MAKKTPEKPLPLTFSRPETLFSLQIFYRFLVDSRKFMKAKIFLFVICKSLQKHIILKNSGSFEPLSFKKIFSTLTFLKTLQLNLKPRPRSILSL